MKKLTLTLALLALCLGLAACGAKNQPAPQPTPTPEAAQPTAEPTAEPEATPDENPMEADVPTLAEPVENALNNMLEYGQGIAGTSLKNLGAAAKLLDWYGLSQEVEPLYDFRRDMQAWFDGLTDDQKQTFAENWQAVREDIRLLVEDPDGLYGMQEDAGVTNDYTPLKGSYSLLVDAVDELVKDVELPPQPM